MDIFERTIRGLEVGLKVGDIATFDLATCSVKDDAGEVLGREELELFSSIPVRDNGPIVGVLERSATTNGHVSEAMRPLDDSLLVTFDEPIKSFIPTLLDTPYRLVVRGPQIDGIVTWSDVHKLPVRLLVFALITHLEMLMAEAIVDHYGDDNWIHAMKPARQDKFYEKLGALRNDELDPPLIELTEFADKKELLLAGPMAKLDIGGRKAMSQLRRIAELRDKVAHAAGFVDDQHALPKFVAVLNSAEEWIERLQNRGA
jgi:hypothetical protein